MGHVSSRARRIGLHGRLAFGAARLCASLFCDVAMGANIGRNAPSARDRIALSRAAADCQQHRFTFIHRSHGNSIFHRFIKTQGAINQKLRSKKKTYSHIFDALWRNFSASPLYHLSSQAYPSPLPPRPHPKEIKHTRTWKKKTNAPESQRGITSQQNEKKKGKGKKEKEKGKKNPPTTDRESLKFGAQQIRYFENGKKGNEMGKKKPHGKRKKEKGKKQERKEKRAPPSPPTVPCHETRQL